MDITKVNISIIIFVFLLGILIGLVGARTTASEKDSETNIIEPIETQEVISTPEPTPEPSKEPEYIMYFDEEDVVACAQMLWGEARGCTLENKIGCVWIVCNRVDDRRFPDTVKAVIRQSGQFHGYSASYPVMDELIDVARDVLTRWSLEKQGVEVERELSSDYLYFHGDGAQNHFRREY